MIRILMHVVISVTMLSIMAHGRSVPLGKGSYLVERTAAVTKVPTDTWIPSITSDFRQKVHSNKWWATLMTKAYSGQLHAQPCAYKAEAGGLQMDYPGVPVILQGEVKRRIFESAFQPDFRVGIAGLAAPAARVAQVGHWSVKARWEDGVRTMEAVMAQGAPFTWFKLTGGPAHITFYDSAPEIWFQDGGVMAFTAYGNHWALFAPTGSAWSGSGHGPYFNSLNGKDYLAVALLPDRSLSTLAFFRKYAYAHVTDTRVTWEYREAEARVVSRFEAVTEAKEGTETGTLFALFRHLWTATTTPLTAWSYRTARGEMKVAEGNGFTTSMTFNGILPVLPDTGYDAATLERLLAGTPPRNSEGLPFIVPTETYTCGKSLNRFGEAAEIAHALGRTAERDGFLKAMKALLENWFTADGDAFVFYYHRPSHRFIGYPQIFFTGEKGNDHNLHWAYFINAAATVARFDPEWGRKEAWGGMVEMLIRDVAAWDGADSLFAPFSYFDPYEGHGWLDGEGFEIGNNHESTSESMNLNIALIRWGQLTGNKALRDLGLFMYVHETRATEQYWWDVDGATMPEGWAHRGVGLVWSNGGRFLTWFSEEPWHVTGIQIIPNTAGHLYLGRRPDFIPKNFEAARPEVSRWGWYDLHLQYLAYADGERAWSLYHQNNVAAITGEETESPAHTYYHLASLRAVGRLDTTVTADIPSYGVFRKGEWRTYAAWNPEAQARNVRFSDGHVLAVPARSQARQRRSVGPDAVRRLPPGVTLKGRPRLVTVIDPGSLRVSPSARKATFYGLDGRKAAEAVASGGRLRLETRTLEALRHSTWMLAEE